MFARVSHVRYPPEHREDGLQVILEELLPALRAVAGYHGCCLLADGKPGRGLGLVLWETEEAADAAAMNAAVAEAHVKLATLGLTFEGNEPFGGMRQRAAEMEGRDDASDRTRMQDAEPGGSGSPVSH